MKKQQLQEWREKTPAEIEAQVNDLATKLSGAYLAKAAHKLDNVAMIKNLRREIAQLKTIAGEKAASVEKVTSV